MIGQTTINIDLLANSGFWTRKTTWRIWLTSCLAILALHLLTLEFDPLILQDEVQILDYG